MKRKITIGGVWGIIHPTLIYTGISIVISFLASFMVSLVYFSNNPDLASEIMNDMEALLDAETVISNILLQYTMHLTFLAAAITTPLLILFMARDVKKEKRLGIKKEYEKVTWYKYLLIIPFSLFVMYAANIFVSILELFMPEFMIESYDYAATVMVESDFWIMLLAAGVMGPIVEELIFRGLMYKRISYYASEKWAAVISAVMFGIYHWNWIQAPYAFLLGLALAFLYKKYRSILAPIIFHMAANIFSLLISQLANAAGATEEIETAVEYTNEQMLVAYIPMLVVFGVLSAVFWWLINKVVKAKEINNEIINHSNTML